MQSEQKAVIRKYWGTLMQLTEVRALADTLAAKSIFSQTEILNIFSTLDERTNKERFFTEFQDKDEAAFDVLVDWLILTGNNKLARKLAAKTPGITPFIEPEVDQDEEEEEDEITSSIEAELPVIFDESKTPLKIEVSLANEFRDTREHNPHVPFYKCRSKKRGRVLIINNYDFTGTDHKTRTGAEVDEVNLKHLFEQMGGWVSIFNNF